jgi:uncharacterized membrane protein YphA (DoxX/SURF4 family)
MNESIAQPRPEIAPLELDGWKTAVSWITAVLLAVVFLSSGIWKAAAPQDWAVRLAELKVPESLSLAGAIGFGIAETMAGILLLVPRFRRLGAIVTGFLLTAFMIFIGANYAALTGAECSCFPLVKRVVGPGFFVGDGAMLLLAIAAGVWSKPSRSLRTAAIILGAVTVFAFVSYGVGEARQTGTKAPAQITVDGQPYSLEHGKILLFFFDPECMHCFNAAKGMSRLNWGNTKVIAIPVSQPQFAPGFLHDTGLKAVVSDSGDLQMLKKIFPYVNTPSGVALENGRERAALTQFEGDEPAATLKKLEFAN